MNTFGHDNRPRNSDIVTVLHQVLKRKKNVQNKKGYMSVICFVLLSWSFVFKPFIMICSDFTLTLHSITPPPPPPPPQKKVFKNCMHLYVRIFSTYTISHLHFFQLTMIFRGISLVTNVLIVSCFGQKRLLNALNVNVNVNNESSGVIGLC